MQEQNRQLAAILFTDIIGYTAMEQKDEKNALAVTRHYAGLGKQTRYLNTLKKLIMTVPIGLYG